MIYNIKLVFLCLNGPQNKKKPCIKIYVDRETGRKKGDRFMAKQVDDMKKNKLKNIEEKMLGWGDISPPTRVRGAMEMQAEAERKNRAQILVSEGIMGIKRNQGQNGHLDDFMDRAVVREPRGC